jgi:hypothetical protein
MHGVDDHQRGGAGESGAGGARGAGVPPDESTGAATPSPRRSPFGPASMSHVSWPSAAVACTQPGGAHHAPIPRGSRGGRKTRD